MERDSEGYDHLQRGVLLLTLDAAQVTHIHPHSVRELLLRKAQHFTPNAEIRREVGGPVLFVLHGREAH